jgi:hypothetical protein
VGVLSIPAIILSSIDGFTYPVEEVPALEEETSLMS